MKREKRVHLSSLYNFFSKNRKGQIEEYMIWIILAIIVLGLFFFLIFYEKGTGTSLIDKIKSAIPGLG
ncbi:MAG TPA: hypothetical protein VMC80_02455 [Patescibacteria group bacterium]|nr:hypothetical protein [Patescibacteria group bacterium]